MRSLPAARLAPLALFLLFAATRLPRLLALPPFIDESIHVSWARELRADPQFPKPLADGKLLQVVATALALPLFDDPLRAARLASVAAGAVGLLATFRLGRVLRGPAVGWLAALLYVVCPFTVVNDRMALADVFLSSAAALALLATVRAVRRPSPAGGLGLGAAMAAAVLAKVPGLLTLAYPVLGALLLRRRRPLLRPLAAAYLLCAALLVWPLWYFARHTAQAVKLGEGEEPVGPYGLFLENLGIGFGWLWEYWTAPLFLAGALALGAALVRRSGREVFLGAAVLLPVLAFSLFSYYWFPRYLLFSTPPLLVLAAVGLRGARALARGLARGTPRWLGRVAAGLALVAVLAPAARFDLALLRNPASAPWPEEDRFQYVDGWPSGYGTAEAAAFLDGELRRHPEGIAVVVDRHGHRSQLLALRLHFAGEEGVALAIGDLGQEATRHLVREWAESRPTYVVVSPRRAASGWSPAEAGIAAAAALTLRKPDGSPAGALYRVLD